MIRLSLLLLLTPATLAIDFFPIDFSASYNSPTSAYFNPAAYPTGLQTYSCVPMQMPADNAPAALYAWNANNASGANPRTLDIAVGVFGADKVHTIMNTYWGQAAGGLVAVECIGSDGAYQLFDLVGNDDIRDFNQANWTNNINGATTVNAFDDNAGRRLDKQALDLDPDFLDETLDTVRIIDTGGTDQSRAFIVALTVETGISVAIGDVNCDGSISVSDIGPFVLALTDLCEYIAQFSTCEDGNADINQDGIISVSDIGAFVALLTGG